MESKEQNKVTNQNTSRLIDREWAGSGQKAGELWGWVKRVKGLSKIIIPRTKIPMMF